MQLILMLIAAISGFFYLLVGQPSSQPYSAQSEQQAAASAGAGGGMASADVHPAQSSPDAPADSAPVLVVLETTNGNIVLEVHPEWSRLGSERFVELVESGFYDGAPWFRVIDGFVAQCGIAADPALNALWSEKTFDDEPVVMGNKPGYVAFGKSNMPNSRTTHIYINYADNSSFLDPQGFSCFAQVVEGMEVALSLQRCEGDQGTLNDPGGLEIFQKSFPKADYITHAYVQR